MKRARVIIKNGYLSIRLGYLNALNKNDEYEIKRRGSFDLKHL